MTLYGIDIATYQAGEDMARVKAEGFTWVEARSSTGFNGGTVDPQFATFKAGCAKEGLLFVAYHFLYSHSVVSIDHQADVCAKAIGDTSCPVMIDHETADKTGTPSVADAVAFAEAMRARGYVVPLWYLPKWVWGQLSSPALPQDTGMSLVSSAYVFGDGFASSLYPGAGGFGWDSYGGLKPAIWQFTDKATVGTGKVDADAFEGTVDELRALLATGGDMALTADEITKIANEVWNHRPATKLSDGTDWTEATYLQNAHVMLAAQGQQITALQAQVQTLQDAVSKIQPTVAGTLHVTGDLSVTE